VIASIASLFPDRARAFWPFSTNASAAADIFIPDSSTPVLAAATNIDPNPDKGLGDSIHTSGNSALLAYAGPAGTIADVAGTRAPDTISVYVVRPGDTLSEIADMFNVSKNTIIWANNLKGPSDVHPGDTLIILPISGVERTIVKGDTLKSLAKKYNGDANEIAQYNGLDVDTALVVGSTVIIPGGEIITTTSSVPVKQTVRTVGGGGPVVAGYYANPLPGGVITQGMHDGTAVDLGAARGTPIHAAADGTVIIVRSNGGWNGGYGNYVVITHANGTQTLYAHMSSVLASTGQGVSSGQVIGYVGMTGRTSGPHVHFEVRGAANPFRACRTGNICSPQ
jgi:murein DD-endopeptidase MepM/ murein hydrolase activator NlpD